MLSAIGSSISFLLRRRESASDCHLWCDFGMVNQLISKGLIVWLDIGGDSHSWQTFAVQNKKRSLICNERFLLSTLVVMRCIEFNSDFRLLSLCFPLSC